MKHSQRKIRLLSAALCIIMLLSGALVVHAADQSPSFDELIAAQAQAVEANERLMRYFMTGGTTLDYPDYFGGCYIEDNTLHIRLASPTTKEEAALKKALIGYQDVIVYEYGSFSRESAQAYADEIAAELRERGIEVTHWCVDAKTGNVEIGVIPNDMKGAEDITKDIQAYSQRSSCPVIVIEEGAYTLPSSGNPLLVGGDEIKSGNSYLSAGVCGYYNGESALVTCGHGDTSVGASVWLDSELIGTVAGIQYADGESGDFSIIELSSGEMSHKIGSSSNGYIVITGGTYLNPAIGTYVTKYGKTTGYSYGTVTDTNVSIAPATDMVVTGMTRASVFQGTGSLPGDSGGPYLVGDAFCGVHHGQLTTDNAVVFFTPYSLISTDGFTALAEHDCLRWLDDGEYSHKGYCAICKDTVYEAHSKYWDSILGKCTRCGRTGPIMEDLS